MLARIRDNPIGRRKRSHGSQRGDSTSAHSSSSRDEHCPRGRRRSPTNHEDDFREMRIDRPRFEGTFNLDHYLEWIQTFKGFFDIKEYFDEKAFKIVVLKLKKMLHSGMKIPKDRANEGISHIRTWSKPKKLLHKSFVPDNYKHDLYLRVSSLNQGRMIVEEHIRELELL